MTPSSVQVVEPDEFHARFGNLFRALFCGAEARRASFVHQDWTFVLVADELCFVSDEFEPLAAAARQLGEETFVATDVETVPPHQCTRILPWNRAVAGDACGRLLLTVMGSAIFGQSGYWGGLCSKYDYSIVAGEPRFMDPYIAAAGGRAQMQARFIEEFAGSWNDGRGGVRPKEDVIRELFADIGWS